MRKQKSVFFLCLVCGFLFACNSARHLSDNQYLLVKNTITTDSTVIPVEQFENYCKQKPNRKILGIFRFHLGVYNLGVSEKDSKFKKWLRKIGEEPVLFDSSMTLSTKKQFQLFLDKNGFFNANVYDSVYYFPKKKKAKVEYFVKYNDAYTIRSISYASQDTGISPLMTYFQQTSLIKTGERFDESIMEKERERLTNALRDRGYYFFSRNFITIQVDTAFGTHKADVYLYINRINENVGLPPDQNYSILDHQVYRLRNIFIHTDFNLRKPELNFPTDTTLFAGYYILSRNKERILRDNKMAEYMFVKSGDTYLPRDIDYTYTRLQQSNIFSYINLVFKEVPRETENDPHLLDLFVQLSPANQQDFTFESEVSNTGGNLGFAGSVALRNKNLLRGAEVLEIKLKGGLEAIPNFNEAQAKTFYFFNTYEIGPEVTLSLPKFLLPGIIERNTSRYANRKTNFTVGYNIEKRPDYTRWITTFSLSFHYNPKGYNRYIFYLPDINSVRVNLSDAFAAKLAELNDPRLYYSYQTHLITSTRLTWIYTDQKADKAIDFVYFRATGDVAVKATKPSTNPSQYVKIDFDFSYHRYVNRYGNIVYRLAAGYGQPYGTSTALPFEKSFFAGGANSVRAWNTNTLGPGSYSDEINIEQSGDIKIESNIEYRSEIFRFPNNVTLEGASFVDAGNIWTRNEDVSRPGGQFKFNNLFRELGVGAGLGLRFNFSFFIFRLDGAVKLRDPSLPETKRWVYSQQEFVIKDITLNFAIGYPF